MDKLTKPGLYIGLMSGTSCDGIDASLIKTDGLNYFEPISNFFLAYEPDLQQKIRSLFQDITPFLSVETIISKQHLIAVQTLLANSSCQTSDITAIGFHGQTIKHQPDAAISWQIGNPHLLAKNLQVKIIHDFRRGDLATGGQGAPLIPVFHQLLMQKQEKPCIVINIGGVANLTYIDHNELIAFDTGPGNALIDDFMLRAYQLTYDQNGEIAKTGMVDDHLVGSFLQNSYYQQTYPKSLDRNEYISILSQLSHLKKEDAVATLTRLTASSIIAGLKLLPKKPKHIFLCGGGARNNTLVADLKLLAKNQGVFAQINNISQLDNIDSDYIESQGFAYLAARFLALIPSSFRNTTGTKRPNICGSLTLP